MNECLHIVLGWTLATPAPGVEGEAHLMPNDDLKEHEPNEQCWCHPEETQDLTEHYPFVVFKHYTLDGREKYENGHKLN